ncbi:uncharacterized protein with SCP/PR1 domains [Deinococcus peraridilitoris DSM 19664]|uniref:Uncharacterized protein with SCP/PR1 domains n=2 Tax=Deinococcus TaxID=1298 RepID=L0A405_DEIPD|nr:uncharacterized protein with SCP/PR1 domains [Deinococcus peraridilitoris DSM 19664]
MPVTRFVLASLCLLTACAPRSARAPIAPPVGQAAMPPAAGHVEQSAGNPPSVPLLPEPPVMPTVALPTPLIGAAYIMARLNDLRQAGVHCPSGPRTSVPAVRFQVLLTEAARAQAAFMANSGRITHVGPDNSAPRERVARLGVNAAYVSEVIYLQRGGQEEDALRWWLNSSVHCNVLTDPRYAHVGASVTPGAFGTAFVVVLSGP